MQSTPRGAQKAAAADLMRLSTSATVPLSARRAGSNLSLPASPALWGQTVTGRRGQRRGGVLSEDSPTPGSFPTSGSLQEATWREAGHENAAIVAQQAEFASSAIELDGTKPEAAGPSYTGKVVVIKAQHAGILLVKIFF